MRELAQKLEILLLEFVRSPKAASELIGRLLLQKFSTGQVEKVRQITRRTPLILQVEGTNVCNAACVFCANCHMQRSKGVMPLPLFERIVESYAGMGGGPVSLTPVIGEALLDPHLLERLDILEANPAITQVSLTTNGISLEKYSDREVCRLLESLYCVQVSVGGLDAQTYRTMFGVDRFSQVERAMERLLRLNATISNPAAITFAFRTNDRKFESRYRETLDRFRRAGAFVSHIWTYANYAGLVKDDAERNLVVMKSGRQKRQPCLYASVAMSICWDGTITACGCADYEGTRLTLGDASAETLSAIWSGKKRSGLIDSFLAGNPPPVCRSCSAYQADATFALPYFKKVEPHRPLPLEFYHQVWGG